MEISQHIKDILLTKDQVVLNDFGTFTAKYKAAQIHEATNTMSPPSKEVIFDSSQTASNGLLEKQMAAYQNISTADAQGQIAEYVKTLKSKLNAGKKVLFPELGTFTKIKEGIILFTYLPTGNLLLSSYGLPKIVLPEGLTNASAVPVEEGGEKKRRRGWLWLAIPAAAAIAIFALFYFLPETKTKTFAFFTDSYNTVAEKLKKGNNSNTIIAENKKNTENTENTESTDGTVDTSENSVNDENLKDTTTSSTDANLDNNNSNASTENNTGTEDGKSNNNSSSSNSNDNGATDTYVPPVSTRSEGSGQYKYPEKGKSYLIVSSLASAKDAEFEKKKLARIGIETQIIPSGAGRYRLSVGIYETILEAQAEYQKLHISHPRTKAWLWEYK